MGEGGGGVERFMFVSMLVDKVVGCLIEAIFQQKEWGSTSETHSLSAEAMRTRYLALAGWVRDPLRGWGRSSRLSTRWL